MHLDRRRVNVYLQNAYKSVVAFYEDEDSGETRVTGFRWVVSDREYEVTKVIRFLYF